MKRWKIIADGPNERGFYYGISPETYHQVVEGRIVEAEEPEALPGYNEGKSFEFPNPLRPGHVWYIPLQWLQPFDECPQCKAIAARIIHLRGPAHRGVTTEELRHTSFDDIPVRCSCGDSLEKLVADLEVMGMKGEA